jgi:DNA helicase-2/ATP-dependent DNA helicase PcrA
VGLRVYAPRAGRFLEVDESTALFGVYLHILGRPQRGNFGGREYTEFHNWLDNADTMAREIIRNDPKLKQYIEDRHAELETAAKDYEALMKVVERKKWDVNDLYQIDMMKRPLYEAAGLSERARRNIANERFERSIKRRLADRAAGRRGQDPFTLRYFINSATSVDWSVLDLFYRVCGFDHFKTMLDLAESGEDEGPICNLGLISQYLAKFMEEYRSIITADLLSDDGFQHLFFSAYLFALFRLGESEYEDAEDPFPRGRIPFLTVHQAKGLEFPVVIFGNPRKKVNQPQIVETLVRPLLDRAGEPADRQPMFDLMRLFYVALSRAKNLVVIMHLGGQGNYPSEPLRTMLGNPITRIPQFDVSSLPVATVKDDDLPHNYSYTADYLLYQTCARQYMVFRKYGFVPSRSQTMMFGSLVHRTLDDLHQLLIAMRSEPAP